VLEGLLRAISIVASLLVLVGFAFFAIDETREASAQSAAEVAGREAAQSATPSSTEERARERAHSSAREFVDDANDVLLAPFASIADGSDTAWVRRGVPAAIGLIVYGFGIGMLARYSRGRA